MAPAQFENTKNRLAAKLRHLTKKVNHQLNIIHLIETI